jgi:hypothetical protein
MYLSFARADSFSLLIRENKWNSAGTDLTSSDNSVNKKDLHFYYRASFWRIESRVYAERTLRLPFVSEDRNAVTLVQCLTRGPCVNKSSKNHILNME